MISLVGVVAFGAALDPVRQELDYIDELKDIWEEELVAVDFNAPYANLNAVISWTSSSLELSSTMLSLGYAEMFVLSHN